MAQTHTWLSWWTPNHSGSRSSLVPRPSRGGGKAWYALCAHARNYCEIYVREQWACTQNVIINCTRVFEIRKEVPYSGYFSRGNIFVVFVVERRTTKYLHMKKTRCGVVLTQTARATTKFFPRNSQNYDFHENITPRKIPAIRYIHCSSPVKRERKEERH